MYLPESFVRRVLEEKGYAGYEKLYLSSKVGKTKSTGSLYSHILDDLSVRPEDILHIGDNKISDVQNAQRYGIKAVLYDNVIDGFIESDKRVKGFVSAVGHEVGASILTALAAWRRKMGKDMSYWQKLGYDYAGPVCYGYARFIEREAVRNELDRLFFVARDGWTLQKVFGTFNKTIKTNYIYAPRLLSILYCMDYHRDKEKLSRIIIDYYAAENKEFGKMAANCDFSSLSRYEFIQKHFDVLRKMADEELDNYRRYIESKKRDGDKNIGIVDTVTMLFSSQNLINSALCDRVRVHGIYWTILVQFKKDMNYSVFVPFSPYYTYYLHMKIWNFMEFLITSPEMPVKNLSHSGEPIFDLDASDHEKARSEVYPAISDSAVLFAEDVRNIFGGRDIFLSPHILIEWINQFVAAPTPADIAEMSKIWHAWDEEHKQYKPLFCHRISIREALRHPQKNRKLIKDLPWKTPLQSVMLTLLSPLTVRLCSVKNIEIYILPRLPWRILTLTLHIGKIYYCVALGGH
jgi:predicted HAD superfamily hydrolase